MDTPKDPDAAIIFHVSIFYCSKKRKNRLPSNVAFHFFSNPPSPNPYNCFWWFCYCCYEKTKKDFYKLFLIISLSLCIYTHNTQYTHTHTHTHTHMTMFEIFVLCVYIYIYIYGFRKRIRFCTDTKQNK